MNLSDKDNYLVPFKCCAIFYPNDYLPCFVESFLTLFHIITGPPHM